MIRIGFGKDIHQLVTGLPLIIGGVDIPFEKGLLGHSDADVVCHAIADALLGAAALGDIGRLFPDSNPQYKGISSLVILEQVIQKLRNENWEVNNVDCTVQLEKPKIAGYIPGMCKKIAEALSADASIISIKATTSEGLGYTGKGDGVIAEAVASISKQDVHK